MRFFNTSELERAIGASPGLLRGWRHRGALAGYGEGGSGGFTAGEALRLAIAHRLTRTGAVAEVADALRIAAAVAAEVEAWANGRLAARYVVAAPTAEGPIVRSANSADEAASSGFDVALAIDVEGVAANVAPLLAELGGAHADQA